MRGVEIDGLKGMALGTKPVDLELYISPLSLATNKYYETRSKRSIDA